MNTGAISHILLRLVAVAGIGPKRLQRVLEHIPIDQLSQVSAAQLYELGWSKRQVGNFEQGCQELEQAQNWLAQSSTHHLVTLADVEYPARLKEIPLPPPVLFVRGHVDCLSAPQVAMVGSRQAGYSAKEQVRRLAYELAEVGLVITSGLALGIDSAAHYGALLAGQTIAVMGTGIDRIYPARHRQLAEQICQQGALVSEFLPGCPPKAQQFPRRNRVISGLSIGIVVGEAAARSGSLITARYALEQNRELFAIPGNIDNPLSEGPHQLIQHGAKLVTSTADILNELIWLIPDFLDNKCAPSDNSCQQQLPRDELLDNVGYETTTLDQVVERSLLPVEYVVGKLIELEIAGEIASVPGGYVRSRRNP
ncbi:DNA-processing protein DprA [Celerinatantimonas yamalensis]|uniref:DNA-processing protein DprA n=1 Tax=Celerinatantimonas yamalensis TaxID=559956 RepID=A0ABW9GBQ0_9GAMM